MEVRLKKRGRRVRKISLGPSASGIRIMIIRVRVVFLLYYSGV